MRLPYKLALLSASVTIASTVHANTERDLGSHEHGAANLNVVIDGSAIFIELESPWANLIGYEHAPSTDEQRALLSDALTRLEQPETLFLLPAAAGCTGETTNLIDTLSNPHADHEGEHGHSDEHDKHDEHDEHDHDTAENHSELIIEYVFNCESIDNADQILVNIFDFWHGIENLSTQIATSSGQDAMQLNAQAREISLN